MLLQARNDAHWYPVPVTGRFSLERAEAESEEHLMAAVKDAQEQMIAGQAKLGSRFLGGEFVIKGPLDHVEFSTDANSDPGPHGGPDPRNTEAYNKWAKAERARAARQRGEFHGLVDFTLTTTFARKRKQELLTIAPSSGLLVPAHAAR